MNKEIIIHKNTKILFIINIIALFLIFIFRYFDNLLSYNPTVITIFTIINIIFLLFGIFCNIMFLIKEKFENKKYILIIAICFITYFLFNTLGIYFINKPISAKYRLTEKKLFDNCQIYKCETYKTVYYKNYRKYIIEKNYFDFDKNENLIHIEIFYNKEGIYKINSNIYSDKDVFSPLLIKKELQGLFDLYNTSLSEESIQNAFDNRFNGSIKDNKIVYKVTEIYRNKNLYKLKTSINLGLYD